MTDQEILSKLRTADADAFESLYREYGDRLYKSAVFLSDGVQEAEDLVQETFVRAFSALPDFRGRSTLYTWLYRIFLNASHDQRRKQYRHQNFLRRHPPEESTDPIETLIRGMDNEKHVRSLRKALKSQKPKHREIIVLRFYEEMKLNEISEVLNVGIGTVKSRLHHALKYLKASIGDFEPSRASDD